jgi:hypothetical protein
MPDTACLVGVEAFVLTTMAVGVHCTRIEKGEYFSNSGMKPDAAL